MKQGIEQAQGKIAIVFQLAEKRPHIYITDEDRGILKIGELEIKLTACRNGAVMVTGQGLGPMACSKAFHDNLKSLVADVSSRAGFAKEMTK